MKKKIHPALWILLIFVAGLIPRLPLLWLPFTNGDECLFALFIKVWQHGGVPYADAVESKALGVYVFYWFASWISGSFPNVSMLAVHILSIIWTFLTAACVYKISARLFSQKTGFVSALLFVIFTTTYFPGYTSANIEVVLLLPLCLAMLFILRPPLTLRYRHSFLAGLGIAAAMLCKYQAGILIPVLLLYYGIVLPLTIKEWRFKKIGLHTLFFFLGGLPLPAWMLFYLYKAGGLKDFIFWNVTGNIHYINSGSDMISWKYALLQRILPFLAATGLVWYLTGERLAKSFRARKEFSRDHLSQECLLWLWFFLTFIPVSTGKRFFDHYFLLLFPPASVLAGAALSSWSEKKWHRWRVTVMLAILLPFIVFTHIQFHMKRFYTATGNKKDYTLFKPYADFLREHTNPDDRIFVWGGASFIYWFSDRFPATRFFNSQQLSGRGLGLPRSQLVHLKNHEQLVVPEAWPMLMEDFNKHPPAYIMDIAPTGLDSYKSFEMANYPLLMDFVRAHYVQEDSFKGALVFRRIS